MPPPAKRRRLHFRDAVRAMLLMQDRAHTTSELMRELDVSRDAVEHLLRSIREAFPLISTRRRSEVFHSLPSGTISLVGR